MFLILSYIFFWHNTHHSVTNRQFKIGQTLFGFIEPVHVVASNSLSWLAEVEPNVLLWLVWCKERYSSVHHGWNEWLFEISQHSSTTKFMISFLPSPNMVDRSLSAFNLNQPPSHAKQCFIQMSFKITSRQFTSVTSS